jgi:glycerol uptake facilitator-like aquaporin
LVNVYEQSTRWKSAVCIHGELSANPAVTLASSLTNTFAGIRRVDVAPFVGAQLGGKEVATVLFQRLQHELE